MKITIENNGDMEVLEGRSAFICMNDTVEEGTQCAALIGRVSDPAEDLLHTGAAIGTTILEIKENPFEQMAVAYAIAAAITKVVEIETDKMAKIVSVKKKIVGAEE